MACADIPILRLDDHNVTYLQLTGQDAELDFLHSIPEDIVLRIFLAAQYDDAGNIKVTLVPHILRCL